MARTAQKTNLPRGKRHQGARGLPGPLPPAAAPRPLFKFACLYGGVNAITCPNFDASRLDWKPVRLSQLKLVSALAHFNEEKVARALLPATQRKAKPQQRGTLLSRISPRLFCGSVAVQRAPVISLHQHLPCPRLQKRILIAPAAPGPGQRLRAPWPEDAVSQLCGTTNELSRFLHFSQVKATATPLGSHKTTARSRALTGASKSDSFPFPIPLASGHDPSPMLLI